MDSRNYVSWMLRNFRRQFREVKLKRKGYICNDWKLNICLELRLPVYVCLFSDCGRGRESRHDIYHLLETSPNNSSN